MELRAFLKALTRRWWLVAAPVLIVLVHTAATYRPPAPLYQVVMRFSAGTVPAGLSEDYDRYYPWLTSEYIANGLADIAETGAFAGAVAMRLAERGMMVEPIEVQSRITTDNAQSILVVYLTWPDAAGAQAVAEAVSQELTENGAAYFPQLAGLESPVRRLDDPYAAPVGPGLRAQLMGPAVRLGLALAVGAALALAWHYFDPTVQESQELEEMGIAVVGTLPRR